MRTFLLKCNPVSTCSFAVVFQCMPSDATHTHAHTTYTRTPHSHAHIWTPPHTQNLGTTYGDMSSLDPNQTLLLLLACRCCYAWTAQACAAPRQAGYHVPSAACANATLARLWVATCACQGGWARIIVYVHADRFHTRSPHWRQHPIDAPSHNNPACCMTTQAQVGRACERDADCLPRGCSAEAAVGLGCEAAKHCADRCAPLLQRSWLGTALDLAWYRSEHPALRDCVCTRLSRTS